MSTHQFRIDMTCMTLDCGRKLKDLERTKAHTGRTCKLHTERSAVPGMKPTNFLV